MRLSLEVFGRELTITLGPTPDSIEPDQPSTHLGGQFDEAGYPPAGMFGFQAPHPDHE